MSGKFKALVSRYASAEKDNVPPLLCQKNRRVLQRGITRQGPHIGRIKYAVRSSARGPHRTLPTYSFLAEKNSSSPLS